MGLRLQGLQAIKTGDSVPLCSFSEAAHLIKQPVIHQ